MTEPEIPYTVRPAVNGDVGAIKDVVFTAMVEYGLTPDPEGLDADLDDLEGNFYSRGGEFDVLVEPDGRIVGTAGLRPLGNRRAELRKMYLAAHVRRRGLGHFLLRRILNKARELGFEEVTLETNSRLGEAVRLYEKHGFVPIRVKPNSPRCDHVYLLRL